MALSNKNLLFASYMVALLDLISALLYATASMHLFFVKCHWSAIVGILFTFIWLCIIIVLFVGLWKRKIMLIKIWLQFTLVGIAIDFLLLLYATKLAMKFDNCGLQAVGLPFLGLTAEMTFVYVIYLLYITMPKEKKQKKKKKTKKNKKKKKKKQKKPPC